jgi:hypothetical protein
MKYENTISEYGDPGPWEADSREELADGMQSTFEQWANESWNFRCEWVVNNMSKEQYLELKISSYRADFIDGLVEIEDD